jgi:hypothetical protein
MTDPTPSTAKVERFAVELPNLIGETDDQELQMLVGIYAAYGGADRLVSVLPADPAELDAWLEAMATMALRLRSDDAPDLALGVSGGDVLAGGGIGVPEEPAPADVGLGDPQEVTE